MKTTDLIIIGAGPGGYRAAEYAARQGLNVVLFEAGRVGGTCLNEGCIPTKSFARNAEVMLALRDGGLYGLDNLHYDFDFSRVVARKDEVLTQLRSGVETLLSRPGITLVRSAARFTDAHTVCAADGGEGDSYTAPAIVIATGSEPKTLRLEQRQGRILDSSNLLQLDRLPQSLCIIGAGVIGMEFASIFSAFGTQVTVVEFLKECLPALDGDIAKRLRKVLEKRGVTFHLQCAVKAVADGTVSFTNKKGQTESVTAEEVLMAVGRGPRTGGLDLEAAGIATDARGFIPVDPVTLSVSGAAPGLYAIGDVNGLQMLAHAAEAQALRVVDGLMGRPTADTVVPAAIFTAPEAACVGPTEEQLKAQAADYECRKAFWRANGKALAMNESEGMLKLFSEPGAGRILGCHAYGAHAADIVQEVSALMCRDTTVGQLAAMIHIHPTLSEILKAAAEQ